MSLVTPLPPGDEMPVGTVIVYALPTPPQEWALCDGSVVLASTPLGKALVEAGNPYGDDGTNPRVPAIQGRTIVGDNGSGSYAVGGTGGVEQVTLTVNQMPSHDHAVILTDPGHHHYLASGPEGGPHPTIMQNGNNGAIYGPTANAWTGVRVLTDNKWDMSRNTGGGQAHDNMPPFIVLNHIIKVGA